MIYVAYDPGKTTGAARYDTSDGSFISGQLTFDGVCAQAHGLGQVYESEVTFIAESFLITMHTVKNTQAPWSLEVIGVLRHASRLYAGRDLTLQSPSTAKRFATDDKLKLAGWHVPGKGHANDAARHLLVALVQRGVIDAKLLIS